MVLQLRQRRRTRRDHDRARSAAIAPGSTVAVVGCGPLGLSAVQGARIAGASTIIAHRSDPSAARRWRSRSAPRTCSIPTSKATSSIERVRELSERTDQAAPGAEAATREAAGAERAPTSSSKRPGAELVRPKLEAGPDPTGILPMQQAYEMCAAGGHVVTTGLVRGDHRAAGVPLRDRRHLALTAARPAAPTRCATSRDSSSCSTADSYDAKALATRVVPLQDMLGAYEEVAYRTTVTAIMTA